MMMMSTMLLFIQNLNILLFSVNKSEKTDFLNHFYKHCMHGKFFLNCLSSSGFIGLKCDFIQTKKRL